MKVLEFHPDDLLDRELAGTLSPSDGRRLEQHVRECASCRLERQLRVDFEQELAPGSPQGLQTFVSGAMRMALAPLEQAPTEQGPTEQGPALGGASRSRTRRRGLTAVLTVGLVAGSGLAAAQSGWGGRVLDLVRERVGSLTTGAAPPSTPSTLSTPSARSVASAPSPHRAPLAETLAVQAGADTPPAQPSVQSPELPPRAIDRPRVPAAAQSQSSFAAVPPQRPPAASAPALGSSRALRSGPRESLPGERRSPPPPKEVTEAPAVEAPAVEAPAAEAPAAEAPVKALASPTASGLFERANAARRQGHGSEALELYDELRAAFPASAEARLSLALAARLQLDRGQTEAALKGFDAYLAIADDVLREQALAGRALALGRRGLVQAEREGWRALLRAYPSSSYAALAAQRLRQGDR
jgi:hypothetical protein